MCLFLKHSIILLINSLPPLNTLSKIYIYIYIYINILIGDQRFISQKGHHVHDGEHSELKLNTGTLGRDMNRKKKFKNGNTLCKTPFYPT